MAETSRFEGMELIEHQIDVPLDHAASRGPTLRLFAREVTPVGEPSGRPALLFLQGGPGGAAPRPRARDGWIGAVLAAGFRVVLLDQRGTGRSAPIDPALPPDGDDVAAAAYLSHFRADAIVADAECLRRALLGDDGRWTLLGQSFGGFIALRYLSVAPDALEAVMITGGLPSLERPPLDVYRACFDVLERKTRRFVERHPRETATLLELIEYVADHDVRLADGSPLRARALRQLGFRLGSGQGERVVAEVLETAFIGEGAQRRPSFAFLSALGRLLPFRGSPIYAALHEAIYAQGLATDWAARRALDERLALGPAEPWLTAEMVFPWHFEDVVPLRPWRGAAERLAAKDDWPDLYDRGVLARNTVPVVALAYAEDLFVPLAFSQETADAVRGMRLWVTNEFEHDGIRTHGGRIFERLLAMLRN
ncbi:MAG: alpha/beta fold hydrolase [Trueperaceae bacterium]|nr:MAG: alpha/beta fold hydrolase [Trueperaceae bacterium]